MTEQKKKLFVFDIDGTITHNNKPLKNELINLFDEMIANEITITFASSRSIRGIKSIVPEKFRNIPTIFCNGAFSMLNQRIRYRNAIHESVIGKLEQHITKTNLRYYFELGTNYYYPRTLSHVFYDTLKNESTDREYVDNLASLAKPFVYKIAILDQVTPELIEFVNAYANKIKVYIHQDGTADIVSNSCSKWEALSHLYDRNIYKICAFGNDQNDLEMLLNADYSVSILPDAPRIIGASDCIIHDKSVESLVKQIRWLAF